MHRQSAISWQYRQQLHPSIDSVDKISCQRGGFNSSFSQTGLTKSWVVGLLLTSWPDDQLTRWPDDQLVNNWSTIDRLIFLRTEASLVTRITQFYFVIFWKVMLSYNILINESWLIHSYTVTIQTKPLTYKQFQTVPSSVLFYQRPSFSFTALEENLRCLVSAPWKHHPLISLGHRCPVQSAAVVLDISLNISH